MSVVAGRIKQLPLSVLLIWVPKALRDSIIRAESLDSRGAMSSEGPDAKAERTSSRLVSDFEPGSETIPAKGWEIVGTNQLFSPIWE